MSFVGEESPWTSSNAHTRFAVLGSQEDQQLPIAVSIYQHCQPGLAQQSYQESSDAEMPSSTTTTTTSTTTITMPHSSTPLSAKTNMPSSALPSTSELSQEDDWTKVKDPKEKKRIQNRVAQRTYRHRMKARLGELQARLDSHEGRARSQSATSSSATPPNLLSDLAGPPPQSLMSSCGVPLQHMQNPYMTVQHHTPSQTGTEDSPPPMVSLPSSEGKPLGQMPLPIPPNLYEQPVDDTDHTMFPHATRMMNSPPRSQASPQPNGLLSPPSRSGVDQPQKMNQDWMMDCLKYQTQLLNRLHPTEGEHPNYPQPYVTGDDGHAILSAMSQPESMSAIPGFSQAQPHQQIPTTQEGLEYGFDGSVHAWKTEPGQGPSPSETLSFGSIPTAPSSGHLDPALMDPTSMPSQASQSPPKHQPLDQIFEGVMKHVEVAGFDSFDALVTAYYSNTFGEASPLAEEQRLSRNRRLPNVIADVSRAADGWSTWERRGYHEEILKTAESMVISESTNNKDKVVSEIGPMLESPESPSQCSAEAINAIKRAVQGCLPNSWALTMALAADSKTAWNRDRSNTALATILLLKFSGRIPNEKLLQLLESCLV